MAETHSSGPRNSLVGRTFGRLTVERFAGYAPGGGWRVLWDCACSCGRRATVRADELRKASGTRSCGCLRIAASKARGTHGRSNTSEYRIWASMLQRCHDRNSQAYRHYGGRGIEVCGRWRTDFAAFLADMGERPGKDYSIERADNDGHYCPENCSWVPRSEQPRNRRNTVRITVDGVTATAEVWSRKFGVKAQTIAARLRKGWPPKEAVTTPAMRLRRKASF